MNTEKVNRVVVEKRGYFSCSRAVLHALQQQFDFISDELKTSAVLITAGGWENLGSCGAYSGALMGMSVKFVPRSEELSEEEKEELIKSFNIMQEFRDWFIAEFGGVTCLTVQRHQLGRCWNFMDDEEVLSFINRLPTLGGCGEVITKAVRKAAEIISRELTR